MAGLGLLGCGVVGSAVVRGLQAMDSDLRLAAVAVRDVGKPRACDLAGVAVGGDPLAVVEDPAVDVVVEVMGGVEPARALVERALRLGKPVVTANKALLAAHGPALRACAGAVPLRYEAAVAGAVPVVRALSALLTADRITKIEGVLNGTTTFVLSRMESAGVTLAEAVAEAQARGYAEADPTRDLDGTDAADKLAVLVQHAFGEPLRSEQVQRLGIDWLEPRHMDGQRRWRLVATAVRGRCARVEPVPLRAEHPFARLTGPDNAVTVYGERSGPVTLSGAGAGGDATACAVLADLADAADWLRSASPALV